MTIADRYNTEAARLLPHMAESLVVAPTITTIRIDHAALPDPLNLKDRDVLWHLEPAHGVLSGPSPTRSAGLCQQIQCDVGAAKREFGEISLTAVPLIARPAGKYRGKTCFPVWLKHKLAS